MKRPSPLTKSKARVQPVTWVLGALTLTALVAGVVSLAFDLGPAPAGAGDPAVPSVPVDALACGRGQPAVGGVIDYASPPPGERMDGPDSAEEALEHFLSIRLPGLEVGDFETSGSAENSLVHFVIEAADDSRTAEVTVRQVDDVWRVTDFDMCNSVYEAEVQRQ